MMPKNIPDESADSSLPEQPPVQSTKSVEPRPSKKPLLLAIIGGVLVCVGLAAYGYIVQSQITTLQKALTQTQTALAGTSAELTQTQTATTANTAKLAEAFTKVNAVDTRSESKFKGYDDYIAKTLPSELKKIAQLEARMVEDDKALATRTLTNLVQIEEIKQGISNNTAKVETIIQVIKGQDRILRTVIPVGK